MKSVVDKLRSARVRGVPLIAIRTSDQPALLATIAGNGTAVVCHDCIRGFSAANDAGSVAQNALIGDMDSAMFSDAATALECLAKCPPKAIICMLGADRWTAEPRPAMGALLLRDRLASIGSTLVLVGPSFSFAGELGSDVYLLDDPSPDATRRGEIILETATAAGLFLDAATYQNAVCFTRGLSGFSTSQTTALAMSPDGMDLDVLRDVWREAINSYPGLRVELPQDKDVIAGLDAVLAYVDLLKQSKTPFESVVFVDEIEKAMAGSSGKANDGGATEGIAEKMLSHMEDTKSRGLIAAGPPGTGKTLCARAIARMLGVPLITLDLGALKGGLVGDTERNSRTTFGALRALAGNAFWVGTANRLEADDRSEILPPGLFRRFTSGVWFFDLPNAAERNAIWSAQLGAYGLDASERWGDDAGWTGADIRNVVREASDLGLPVADVARLHVPASRASAGTIERVRRAAVGCYRSASYPGAYQYPTSDSSQPATTARRFDFSNVGTKGEA